MESLRSASPASFGVSKSAKTLASGVLFAFSNRVIDARNNQQSVNTERQFRAGPANQLSDTARSTRQSLAGRILVRRHDANLTMPIVTDILGWARRNGGPRSTILGCCHVRGYRLNL